MAQNSIELDIEKVATQIVDSAIKVHRSLGPGLLESAYQHCLTYELRKRGFVVDSEVYLPINYDGIRIDTGYRIDLLVNDLVVIENKTVDEILPIHGMQLLTYLRLGNYELGFVLNWKVTLMKNGIKRIVNKIPEKDTAIAQ
jgi:GxxExxY protein